MNCEHGVVYGTRCEQCHVVTQSIIQMFQDYPEIAVHEGDAR